MADYANDPFFATFFRMQTGDGSEGLLADIIADRSSSGEDYQIFQDAAIGGTNDVVGQLSSGVFNNFGDVIDVMVAEIGATYPNWTETQVSAFVQVLILDQAITTQFGADNFIEAIEARADEILGNQCFVACTMISMWDGSKKPIEKVMKGDQVLSFDKQGKKVPGNVTQVMSKDVKILLNFFGTLVTPGHVYYCLGDKFTGNFATLIDILRADGAVQQA